LGASRIILAAAAAALALVGAAPAAAQDVTGIPNADVRAGYRAVSPRTGYSPGETEGPSTFAEHVNYQHNFSEAFGVSTAILLGDRGEGPLGFRGIQT
jgi:hypothetical protein